jgi:WD40 repeat protein
VTNDVGQGASPWGVVWASRTDDDPRLARRWAAGSGRAVAWWSDEERPLLAAALNEGAGRNRVWVLDVEAGVRREFPTEDEISGLCFVSSADGPVLVAGLTDGLRVWDMATGALLGSADGVGGVRELHCVRAGGGTQIVTHGGFDRIRRWWFPSGSPVVGASMADASEMTVGRLSDGRPVLVSGGKDLVMWDLDRDREIWTLASPGPSDVRRIALSMWAGRDLVTVVGRWGTSQTFDARTGEPLADPTPPHDERMLTPWETEVAVVGGTVAIAARWRIHLYDITTSRPAGPPLPGPVGRVALLHAVRWRGRDLLLSRSDEDGFIALWDLARPVDPPAGHDQRISRITRAASADVVVSVDAGGTLVARDTADGRLLHSPTVTGAQNTRALAAWVADGEVIAATGAGSHDFRDPYLRRLNVTTGETFAPTQDLRTRFVHHLAASETDDGAVLVATVPPGRLETWSARDGRLLGATRRAAKSGMSGFGTGSREGRPVVVVSTWYDPMAVYTVDDLGADPILIVDAGNDGILTVSGPYIVTRHFDDPGSHSRAAHVVRVFDTAGRMISAGVRRPASVTLAAVRSWPQAYLAHDDGTISLTDLLSGQDLGPRFTPPGAPISLATTADGDLLVGYGSDVARVSPPPPVKPGAQEPGSTRATAPLR